MHERFAIGLTGGIGCGKTTVANLFAARGAGIIDTDAIAHQLTAPGGAAMPAILETFGASYLRPDGAMNRARMRELVFSAPDQKLRLEAILHPLIGSETRRAAQQTAGDYLMFVVPLLIESGRWKGRVARVLAIDCPEALQIERVVQRSGISPEQVRAIMATQVTRAVRLAAADDVLVNEQDQAALAPQVDRLHAMYKALATAATGAQFRG
jgi:dephospho-CoA kinase